MCRDVVMMFSMFVFACALEACWLGWRVSCRCAGGQGATSLEIQEQSHEVAMKILMLFVLPKLSFDKIRHTMVTP